MVLAGLLAAACDGMVASPEIYPGLRGGMTIPQALTALHAQQSQIEVVENTQNPPTDLRPPYHLQEIHLRGANCRGIPCRLHLIFFNDGLAEVIVYLKNPEEFKQTLEWARGKNGMGLQSYLSTRGVRYIEGDNPQFGRFIGFGDAARLAELRKWIERYA
jgi:hypothetical protein